VRPEQAFFAGLAPADLRPQSLKSPRNRRASRCASVEVQSESESQLGEPEATWKTGRWGEKQAVGARNGPPDRARTHGCCTPIWTSVDLEPCRFGNRGARAIRDSISCWRHGQPMTSVWTSPRKRSSARAPWRADCPPLGEHGSTAA